MGVSEARPRWESVTSVLSATLLVLRLLGLMLTSGVHISLINTHTLFREHGQPGLVKPWRRRWIGAPATDEQVDFYAKTYGLVVIGGAGNKCNISDVDRAGTFDLARQLKAAAPSIKLLLYEATQFGLLCIGTKEFHLHPEWWLKVHVLPPAPSATVKCQLHQCPRGRNSYRPSSPRRSPRVPDPCERPRPASGRPATRRDARRGWLFGWAGVWGQPKQSAASRGSG